MPLPALSGRVQEAPARPTLRKALRSAFYSLFLLLLIGAFFTAASDLRNSLFAGESTSFEAEEITRSIALGLAYTGLILLMVQFLLASRLAPLEYAFGLGRLLVLHRAVALIAFACLMAHPILLEGVDQAPPLLAAWMLYCGLAALVLLIITVITSMARPDLAIAYEKWKNLHRLTFVAVLFGALHAFHISGAIITPGLPRYLLMTALSLFILLTFWAKVVRPVWLRQKYCTIKKVQPLNHDVCAVVLTPPAGKVFRHLPGQFAFLEFPGSAMPRQQHPFTIASSPTNGKALHFAIKASGDFTEKLPEMRPGQPALVEGPYGDFSHLLAQEKGDLLLIAGGIGITPLWSMLQFLRDKADSRAVTLIWANKTSRDILLADAMEKMTQDLPDFRVVYLLSQPEDDWTGPSGLPDHNNLARLLTEEEKKRGVFLCGPPPMMSLVQKCLRDMGVPPSRIHKEAFSL